MKINNISNIDKKLLPSEFEPVFEEDERPEKTHKEISSTRLKIIKDSKEDSISSNEPKQQYYLSTNIYDKIFDSIQEEDHNENLFEQELKSSKSYKNFTDKLDGIEEMNDLVFDTFNIESIIIYSYISSLLNFIFSKKAILFSRILIPFPEFNSE